MKRYHVEFTERVDHFGEYIVSGVTTGDGTFKGVFSYDGDLPEFIDSLLNDDENVIRFTSEDHTYIQSSCHPQVDMESVSSAAAILGRKGGLVKSEAKATAVRENGKLGGRPSGKLIARWSDDIKVGIWDNEKWTLRLYEDRALLKFPTVSWRGNSGNLEYASTRITGRVHNALLNIAAEQADDDEDYTEQVRELIWEEMA
jgi:hypothetical protein